MIPVPPLPGADKYKNVAASLPDGWSRWPANMVYYLTKTAEGRALVPVAQKIWSDAHNADPLPDTQIPAYGSDRYRLWMEWNGKAWSIGTPLPFPLFPDLDVYFPGYRFGATAAEVAPGEVPFNQCDNYRTDGNLQLADYGQRYAALADTDILPGTVITKAQGRMNIKVEYNDAAKAYGCTTVPFPEALGQTRMTAEPPPVVAVDTGNADSGIGAPVPAGNSSPTGGGPVTVVRDTPPPVIPPPLPRPLPTPPSDFGSVGQVTPAGDPQATASGGGRMWLVILAVGVVLYVAGKGE